MNPVEFWLRIAIAALPIAYFMSAAYDLVIGWITDGSEETQ